MKPLGGGQTTVFILMYFAVFRCFKCNWAKNEREGQIVGHCLGIPSTPSHLLLSEANAYTCSYLALQSE